MSGNNKIEEEEYSNNNIPPRENIDRSSILSRRSVKSVSSSNPEFSKPIQIVSLSSSALTCAPESPSEEAHRSSTRTFQSTSARIPSGKNRPPEIPDRDNNFKKVDRDSLPQDSVLFKSFDSPSRRQSNSSLTDISSQSSSAGLSKIFNEQLTGPYTLNNQQRLATHPIGISFEHLASVASSQRDRLQTGYTEAAGNQTPYSQSGVRSVSQNLISGTSSVRRLTDSVPTIIHEGSQVDDFGFIHSDGPASRSVSSVSSFSGFQFHSAIEQLRYQNNINQKRDHKYPSTAPVPRAIPPPLPPVSIVNPPFHNNNNNIINNNNSLRNLNNNPITNNIPLSDSPVSQSPLALKLFNSSGVTARGPSPSNTQQSVPVPFPVAPPQPRFFGTNPNSRADHFVIQPRKVKDSRDSDRNSRRRRNRQDNSSVVAVADPFAPNEVSVYSRRLSAPHLKTGKQIPGGPGCLGVASFDKAGSNGSIEKLTRRASLPYASGTRQVGAGIENFLDLWRDPESKMGIFDSLTSVSGTTTSVQRSQKTDKYDRKTHTHHKSSNNNKHRNSRQHRDRGVRSVTESSVQSSSDDDVSDMSSMTYRYLQKSNQKNKMKSRPGAQNDRQGNNMMMPLALSNQPYGSQPNAVQLVLRPDQNMPPTLMNMNSMDPRMNQLSRYFPAMPGSHEMTSHGGIVALSPMASKSLLTCSEEFKKNYPHVYLGLCKGLLDVRRLIAHEIVIPVKEEISLKKNAIRSRKAVTVAITDQLWRSLQGKFPDPVITPKIVKKVADYFYDKIEYGIKDAETDRSFLQWLFRFDVENAIDLRITTSLSSDRNSVLANVEGTANMTRRKGDMFNLVTPDTIQLNLDCIIKALFLNGGQLAEINSDSLFIDRVQGSQNRLAQQFVMY